MVMFNHFKMSITKICRECGKEKELSEFKNLLQASKRWHEAKILRDFLSTIEEKAIREDKHTDEIKKWLNWAQNKANWYDPTIQASDDLLGEYKHTI